MSGYNAEGSHRSGAGTEDDRSRDGPAASECPRSAVEFQQKRRNSMGTQARRRFSQCGPAMVPSPSQSDSDSIGSCGDDAAGERDGRPSRPTRDNADKVLS